MSGRRLSMETHTSCVLLVVFVARTSVVQVVEIGSYTKLPPSLRVLLPSVCKPNGCGKSRTKLMGRGLPSPT